jgi:hypothetical protein
MFTDPAASKLAAETLGLLDAYIGLAQHFK